MKKILISIPEKTYEYVLSYQKQLYNVSISETIRSLIRSGLEAQSTDFKKDRRKNLKIISKRLDEELLALEQDLYGKK